MGRRFFDISALLVIVMAGQPPVPNTDYGPDTCAFLAKQLSSTQQYADSFCVSWVNKDGEIDTDSGDPVLWTKTKQEAAGGADLH